MLAMGAGGMQLMIAFWAIVESALHRRVTLRAATEQRLPQHQIQDDAETVSNHNRNDRPQNPIHTPARSVAVDIDDQQEIAAEYGSGKKTEKTPNSGRRGIFLNRHQGLEEDLDANKKQDSHPKGPFGDKTQLLGKLSSYVAS
jgi:hypothetical protein